jgi:F-type H+/Na+-transporting ATPase subunit alpha
VNDARRPPLRQAAGRFFEAVERAAADGVLSLRLREQGKIVSVGRGVARLTGLPGATMDEILRFPGGRRGTVFNLDADSVGVVLLDDPEGLEAGQTVERTGRVLDVPVGEGLLGRVVDGLGRPLDRGGPVDFDERWPVEREAPGILARAPVRRPLQTGLKVVDALVPVGRGQRELIVGDRETGKTAVALDAIINQRDSDVLCVYCAIGQRNAAVAKAVDQVREHASFDACTFVVASGEDPPGLQYVAAYAAMTIAESFMYGGRDVLVIYDDLTRHARAYRELSLLSRRPPGREAYPGDIFHIHARLLERATQLSDEEGGGSITALPIVETQAQNMSAYIPTNLISITDGQIYLSPTLFQQGVLPPVDVGRSVSRVGGDAQRAAYRAVAGSMRLSYARFEELERFARFSTQLDEETRATLEHGRRVREILKQPQYTPLDVPAQVAVLSAVAGGHLDDLRVDRVGAAAERIRKRMRDDEGFVQRVMQDEELSDEDHEAIRRAARDAVEALQPQEAPPEDEETHGEEDEGEG